MENNFIHLNKLPNVVTGTGPYFTRNGRLAYVHEVAPMRNPDHTAFRVKGTVFAEKNGRQHREFEIWHDSGRRFSFKESSWDLVSKAPMGVDIPKISEGMLYDLNGVTAKMQFVDDATLFLHRSVCYLFIAGGTPVIAPAATVPGEGHKQALNGAISRFNGKARVEHVKTAGNYLKFSTMPGIVPLWQVWPGLKLSRAFDCVHTESVHDMMDLCFHACVDICVRIVKRHTDAAARLNLVLREAGMAAITGQGYVSPVGMDDCETEYRAARLSALQWYTMHKPTLSCTPETEALLMLMTGHYSRASVARLTGLQKQDMDVMDAYLALVELVAPSYDVSYLYEYKRGM